MEIVFLPDALEDYTFWIKSGNKSVLKKIALLIEDIKFSPNSGLGKPEALKYKLAGLWSRRIDNHHRLVYTVEKSTIFIHSLKGHYE